MVYIKNTRIQSGYLDYYLMFNRKDNEKYLLVIGSFISVIATQPLEAQANNISPVTVGRFITHCQPTVSGSFDPINGSRKSHRHEFFGPKSLTPQMELKQITRKNSSCSFSADHSAYWHPTLYIGKTRVEPSRIQAYYNVNNEVRAFPLNLSYKSLDAVSDPVHIKWYCSGKGEDRTSNSAQSCRDGEYLMASVEFPSCWDGHSTDSIDHRSHLTYKGESYNCSRTHPVEVPKLTLFIQWSCNKVCGATSDLKLSSGATNTFHADFLAGWKPKELNFLINKCKNKDCGVIR